MNKTEELKESRRKYSNARRRAKFWSGNPSFINAGPKGRNLSSSKMSEQYELAMCDCDSWEKTIEGLTGKKIEHYDPRAKFRAAFTKLIYKH